MTSKTRDQERALRIVWWALLVCVVGLTVYIRVRLLDMPLERDEGEYAYAGQLMLQGIPPYKLAYNMKFPGTYAAYAVMMSIFGQTIGGIHLGLLCANIASAALIVFIGRRILNTTAGTAAGISYLVLSLNPWVAGFAGHATQFLLVPVLAGVALLVWTSSHYSMRTIFVAGLFLGVGLMMKQPAIFFTIFGLAYLIYRDQSAGSGWKQIILRSLGFTTGAILPFAANCLILWQGGLLGRFWFWTIIYAREYGSLLSLAQGIRLFIKSSWSVMGYCLPIWLLAGLGLTALAWDRRFRANALFLIGFTAFSAAAVCPGLYFREHYFVLVLPAVSLLAGAAVASVEYFCSARFNALHFFPLLVFGAASLFPFFQERKFFFAASPLTDCRMLYWPNPFPESIRVADYLRQHTNTDDRIAVIGSEPQIYFYAKRHSATGYIYTYGLMEPHKYALEMQQEMIREIESARPKYLVLIAVQQSWLAQANSNRLIVDWVNEYCARNFTQVGLVDLISEDRSDYFLPGGPGLAPQSPNYILIYERNPKT
jgi:Dolichyl-phosphate-mannose-protein mannosyltransferase